MTPDANSKALLGLARLMKMAYEKVDLQPLAEVLLNRSSVDARDANALMDLSTLLFLRQLDDLAMSTLAEALKVQRLYELPASLPTKVRLLAIMTIGDLMANAPLAFLCENSDISLSMYYVLPGELISQELPPHDMAMIAVSESASTRRLLEQLTQSVRTWRKPLLNRPERVLSTARPQAYQLLRGARGVSIPATTQVSREQLQALCGGQLDLLTVLSDGAFPLIVRPVGSHAGHGLQKIETRPDIARYLNANPEHDFYISRFIDYRDSDGQFRKYRVVLIDGVAHAAHQGVSSHWMIHYLNAGMDESAQKRGEEAAFMSGFESNFAVRHAGALQAIFERFGLEYLVIDCAETADGNLLVFEVDPGAVVHSLDPIELFPYKAAAMKKIYESFRNLLLKAPHAN